MGLDVMESINGRLRLDVSQDQIEILLERFVKRGYQVCCDWDWHLVTRHETTWYFIYDRENHRFMELYNDTEAWVLRESNDLITQKIYPDRGELPWKNIKSINQIFRNRKTTD